jgi:hypothetical protein
MIVPVADEMELNPGPLLNDPGFYYLRQIFYIKSYCFLL